jgi:hypothetical protein
MVNEGADDYYAPDPNKIDLFEKLSKKIAGEAYR